MNLEVLERTLIYTQFPKKSARTLRKWSNSQKESPITKLKRGSLVGPVPYTLAEVVGQNTTFMLKVSAANKRTGQQILALRDQLNHELNPASRPADQMSAVSQEDLFHDSEDYDPAFPTDTRIGEPSPPGLESPATGMQP